MVLEIAEKYREKFPLTTLDGTGSGEIPLFRPYAPASVRHEWEALPESLKADLIQNGEKYIKFEYPILPAVKYMEFCRIGNRSMFEELYFNRRRAVNALVLAECVEHQGRFTDDIINGVMAVCEESGWQLPAHNSYREGNQISLCDHSAPVLDLFACETGAQMAMVSYLLGDELDAQCPVIDKRIHQEIHQRILTPYLNCYFNWMGEYGQKVNNWTPWCTQNVLITVLSMKDISMEDKQKVIERAAKSLDIFLDAYGEDGCCNEGAGYYHAAGLCLFNAIEVLSAVCDPIPPNAGEGDLPIPPNVSEGDLPTYSDLYLEKKIQNIAPYIMNVHVDDTYYANFADCSPTAGRAGVREFLFAKRVGNENMMRFAAKDHKADSDYLLPRCENLFYRLQAAFTEAEIAGYDISKPIVKEDLYYDSVGLMIAGDAHYFLAAKAGCNDDSHNHNDTGSITVYHNGKPMLIDVGVETYSRKTFSPHRYEIWTMQSAYHNVLTFGETMQLPGSEYAAKVSEVTLEEDRAVMTMELAGCYPEGTVQSYIRRVEFEKGKEIRITDTCTPCPEGTFLSLMTQGKPVVEGACMKLSDGGEIQIEGSSSICVERIQLTDPKLQGEWGTAVYRTKIYLNEQQLCFIIK